MQQDPQNIVEALLFAAEEPMSPQAIDEYLTQAGVKGDVGAILKSLQEHYQDRGVHLVQMNNLWAFRTARELGDVLNLEKEITKKMSRATLETMAIIAYHQPVTRAEIENIRGVATGKGTLDILMEMGWVKPGRRRETPGRPLTWVTTPGFMDHFALESMNDLPGLDDLKAAGLLDRRPAIDTLADSDDLFAEEEKEVIEN